MVKLIKNNLDMAAFLGMLGLVETILLFFADPKGFEENEMLAFLSCIFYILIIIPSIAMHFRSRSRSKKET